MPLETMGAILYSAQLLPQVAAGAGIFSQLQGRPRMEGRAVPVVAVQTMLALAAQEPPIRGMPVGMDILLREIQKEVVEAEEQGGLEQSAQAVAVGMAALGWHPQLQGQA
jgi:hypothetical protein